MRRSQVLPGYPHSSAGAYGDALAQARSRSHCPTGTSKYSWIYEHAVPLVSRSQTLTRKAFVWESGYARLQFAYLDPFHLTCLSLAGPRRCVQRCARRECIPEHAQWVNLWTMNFWILGSGSRLESEQAWKSGNETIWTEIIRSQRPHLDIKYRFSDSPRRFWGEHLENFLNYGFFCVVDAVALGAGSCLCRNVLHLPYSVASRI